MVFALILVIAIAADGMYDQVKLILLIFNEEKSIFTVFIMFMLYLQLCVASAVI